MTVRGRRAAPTLAAAFGEDGAVQGAERLVYFRGLGHVPTAILRRYALPAGTRVGGPAILEEPGSTTLVEPGMAATVLPDGQLLIEIGEEKG